MMARSMTGYGTAALETEALKASVTVRSVNHRFLDVALQVSRRLQPLEPEIKRLVQVRVQRGRVELSMQAAMAGGPADVTVTARPLVADLVRVLRELRDAHGLAGEVSVSDVARFPSAFEIVEAPSALDEERRAALLALVERALDELERMREAEGAHLAADLEAGLAAVLRSAAGIEAASEAGRAERRDTLLEKVRALAQDAGLDEARLYPEVVRLADRHDVAEELQRLRSHVGQVRAALREPGPCGKRLDFLAQELAREANTIGSKASSAGVVNEVVALKAGIERFREQVQNLE